MAAERDGARKMAGAANERSSLLAAELVGLEEQLLKARAQHLKLERDLVRSVATAFATATAAAGLVSSRCDTVPSRSLFGERARLA